LILALWFEKDIVAGHNDMAILRRDGLEHLPDCTAKDLSSGGLNDAIQPVHSKHSAGQDGSVAECDFHWNPVITLLGMLAYQGAMPGHFAFSTDALSRRDRLVV